MNDDAFRHAFQIRHVEGDQLGAAQRGGEAKEEKRAIALA